MYALQLRTSIQAGIQLGYVDRHGIGWAGLAGLCAWVEASILRPPLPFNYQVEFRCSWGRYTDKRELD